MSFSRFVSPKIRYDLPGEGWVQPINWEQGMKTLDTVAAWKPMPGWNPAETYFPGDNFYHPLAEPGMAFSWDNSTEVWVFVRLTDVDHHQNKAYQSIKKAKKKTKNDLARLQEKQDKVNTVVAKKKVAQLHLEDALRQNNTKEVEKWQRKVSDLEKHEKSQKEKVIKKGDKIHKKEDKRIHKYQKDGTKKLQKHLKKQEKKAAKARKHEAKLRAKGKKLPADEEKARAEKAEEKVRQVKVVLGLENDDKKKFDDPKMAVESLNFLVSCGCLDIADPGDATEQISAMCGSDESMLACMIDCREQAKEENAAPDGTPDDIFLYNTYFKADLEPDVLADAFLTLHPDLDDEEDDEDDYDYVDDQEGEADDADADEEHGPFTNFQASEALERREEDQYVSSEDFYLFAEGLQAPAINRLRDSHREMSSICKNAGFELGWNLDRILLAAGVPAGTLGQSPDTKDTSIRKRDTHVAIPLLGGMAAAIAAWATADILSLITLLVTVSMTPVTIHNHIVGRRSARRAKEAEARDRTRERLAQQQAAEEKNEAMRAASREKLKELGRDGYRKLLEDEQKRRISDKELDNELERIVKEVKDNASRSTPNSGKGNIARDLGWVTSTKPDATAVKRAVAPAQITLKSIVVHAAAASVGTLMAVSTPSPASAVAQLAPPNAST